MLAYACSPYLGSEPGTGWRRAVENARRFDTWVICEQGEFEPDIRRYEGDHGPVPGLSFCFVPLSPLERLVGRVPGAFYLAYNRWHRRAYRVAVELHARVGFDLVHQANMCGFREPGYLWRLPLPFVWGPIGGAQNYPVRFLWQAGFAGALHELARGIVNRMQLRFSGRVKRAVARAAAIMAANSETRVRFARAHGVAPELFLEIGVDSLQSGGRDRNDGGELRLLWSGEFKHHKALQLLLSALARVPPSVSYELKILGEGPLAGRWKRLASSLGVASRCRWLGWLPLAEALAEYDWADVLVFTSLRDTAGTVVLEALSKGVPVVCLDHQGAGDIVTPKCGVKIPVTRPKLAIAELARILVALAHDRRRIHALSRGAIARAGEFHWERQGERLAGIYRRVLDHGSVAAGPTRQELVVDGRPAAVREEWVRGDHE